MQYVPEDENSPKVNEWYQPARNQAGGTNSCRRCWTDGPFNRRARSLHHSGTYCMLRSGTGLALPQRGRCGVLHDLPVSGDQFFQHQGIGFALAGLRRSQGYPAERTRETPGCVVVPREQSRSLGAGKTGSPKATVVLEDNCFSVFADDSFIILKGD
jgi:hypothetical protein